jgi:hypothetical protein
MHLLRTPSFVLSALFTTILLGASAKVAEPATPVIPTSNVRTVSGNNNLSSEELFTELNLGSLGLAERVFDAAFTGMQKLVDAGEVHRSDLLTIIDMSQPSTQKRLYVLDLDTHRVLFNTLVAHGRNSGRLWANSFSNSLSSLKSSPGFYLTGETYNGDNGYSLRLDGLEKNINDHARARDIVLHGAPYVAENTVSSLGYLGRSWGCPAVPMDVHEDIINTIKDGSCLFIYTPNQKYLKKSPILNS